MANTIRKTGMVASWLACGATLSFVIVQSLQLVRVLQFPMDEILIYGTSLCIVIPFVLGMLALYHATPRGKKFWSHGGLLFSVLYAVFVVANYVVQLATVIPAKMRGQGLAVRILDQTPHSMYWNYDAIGYLFMGAAMFIAIPAFSRKDFGKWVRIAFAAHALTTPLIALVYFYPSFSERLLLLGLPWGITAPLAMGVLAVWFKKTSTIKNQPGRAATPSMVRNIANSPEVLPQN